MWVCVAPQQVAPAVCDPDDWVLRDASDPNSWVAITSGLGLYVAIANEGAANEDEGHLIMTSPDGITWTERATTKVGDLNADEWTDICFSVGSGRFVGVAEDGTDGRVIYSDDAISWTYPTSPSNGWNSVISNDSNTFVAVSAFNSGRDTMRSTNNGATWTGSDSGIEHGTVWNALAYGDGTMVAVGTNGTGSTTIVRYSTNDGASWTGTTSGVPHNNWKGVTYSVTLGLFIACASTGTANRIMTSPDGATWTAQDTTGLDNDWQGIIEAEGVVVVVGNSGTVMISYDAITWEARTAAGVQDWRDVAFLEGEGFAAVSTNVEGGSTTAVTRVMTAAC